MQRRDGSTHQQQTLSVTLWSESLACGTAWTSTAEERWAWAWAASWAWTWSKLKGQAGEHGGMTLMGR